MSYEKPLSQKYQSNLSASRAFEADIDPYSPVIVEDLLHGVNEWRNIQDIIRLTFKALTDVVKAQGETLRDLERTMPTKASKAELNGGLSLKANITDVSRTIAEVVSNVDAKVSVDETQAMFRNYVLTDDLQYLLSNKVSKDEVRALIDSKISNTELRREIESIDDKLTDFYNESQRKFAGFVPQRDFQLLSASLEQKANFNEIIQELDNKIDQQTFEKVLSKKMNKGELDNILGKKADINELQAVLDTIDKKLDLGVLDRINQLLDNKVDKGEYSHMLSVLSNKSEKTDLEYLTSSLSNLRVDYDHKLSSIEKKHDSYRGDLESTKHALSTSLSKKVDGKEIDRLLSLVNQKADSDFIEEKVLQIRSDIVDQLEYSKKELTEYRRTVDTDVNEKISRSEEYYDKISEEVYKLTDQLRGISEATRNEIELTTNFVKDTFGSVKREIASISENLNEDIQLVKQDLNETFTKKMDKKEWNENKSKIFAQLDGKVDLLEVQDALNTCQSDLSSRFIEYKEEIKNLIRNHDGDIYNLLSKKANISDINSILSNKADSNTVSALLSQKPSSQELDEVKRKLEIVARSSNERGHVKDVESQIVHQRKTLDDLQKDIMLKANIKDVCTLLDTKSNIDDVNKALLDVHKELDSKALREDLGNIVNDQALINESLCTENIVGRWAWKSGEVKTGSLVPWEIQLTNTLPDNFLWEKDKGIIITVAPGLYEITFGFFAKKKPTVQLLVNGEPIIYVIHHSSGKMKDVNVSKHPSGNITGLTLIDFIVLPARARMSVAYTGEIGGEGFLGLKRL